VAEARRTGVLIYSIGIAILALAKSGSDRARHFGRHSDHVDERRSGRLSTESRRASLWLSERWRRRDANGRGLRGD